MESNVIARAERPPDAGAAQAIDRVLQAERDAQAAVAACERSGTELVGAARERAQRILERATARSVQLHARATKHLEVCASAVHQERMKLAAETAQRLADADRRNAAIDRLTLRLTTDDAGKNDA
jgi:vacuolar-type H+-ATPase subunit H